MPMVEVIESGHVDRNHSTFPTLVRLDDGQIICCFSVGSAEQMTGGTCCAHSLDGGRTWSRPAVVLEAIADPPTTHRMYLSRTKEGTLLAYGQRDRAVPTGANEDRDSCELVLCRSTDGGHTWSDPEALPSQMPGPYEVANPIVVTDDGRWLAPAASYHDGRYGETVVLVESPDQGATWPTMHTVFRHPEKKIGCLEQKVIVCGSNRLLAIAWQQDYEADIDLDNCFSFSEDGGRTWDAPCSTGIRGQTMTPIWLGEDRFLVLYNRRYGRQSVQMCLVRAAGTEWAVEFEGTMWDAGTTLDQTPQVSSQQEISRITFGYPTALRLDKETALATFWCEEEGRRGIRWVRLRMSD